MRKFLFLLLLITMGAIRVRAQDCSFNFTLTGAGNSAAFPNDCAYLWFEYKSTGFTGLSVTLQGAADSSGSPGSFSTLSGTVTLGTNPLTSTTGAVAAITATQNNLAAWLRVNLSGLTGTGTVTGRVYGYRNATIGGGGGGGGGGGCTAPCVVIGPDAVGATPTEPPVQIGMVDAADHVVQPTYCTLSAPISLSGSGLTQIVALSASKQIRICNISVSFASGVDFQLETGTGSNCAGSTTALTGVYKSVLTVALDFNSGTLNGTVSQALCVNLGAGVTGGGVIVYGQY